jgi:hypothetical protein
MEAKTSRKTNDDHPHVNLNGGDHMGSKGEGFGGEEG